MAVVWFGGAFLGTADIFLFFKYTMSGLLSLVLALSLVREVK